MNEQTVLIIDDNIDDQELCSRSLKNSNYNILCAKDSNEGLEVIKHNKPDIVLLDYSLPGNDGLKVLKTIKNNNAHIPVIMLTGQGSESIAVRSLKEGAYDYIKKSSISNKSLPDIIKQAIDHNKQEYDQLTKHIASPFVLIVDDSIDDLERCVRYLSRVEEKDYRYKCISDGTKIVSAIQEVIPDAILLDYSLPGHSGLELISNIHEHNKYIPIIMMTGQGNESIAVRSLKAGAFDYIIKGDITPELLNKSITAAIEHNILEKLIYEQDIKIKVQQKELLEIRERYDVAVHGSSVGLWDWNVVTDEFYWSPRFKEIIGITDNEFIPHLNEFASRLHPDDHNRIMDALEKEHLIRRKPYDVEFRIMHTKGHYVWVHARGQAIWDKEGKPIRVAGSLDDISEKKANENALEESQAFLKLIMENNPDLIFVKDKDFKIVEANLAFRNIYPKEMQDKIIGYTTVEEYNTKEAAAFLEMDKVAFKKGYSATFEKIKFPDGKERILYTQKVRFQVRNGNKFILGLSRDVSEREALIQSLNDSNEELERFAYLASHDLQEPLRMVVNFTELLEKEYGKELQPQALEYLKFASNAAVRMQMLVNDLLEYSRVGQEAEKLVKVDCNRSLNDAKENLMESIKQHNAQIKHGKLPIIKANPIRITRLLQNIIGNAIKYTNDNVQPNIRITAKERKELWLFSVSDNGIGMKQEYLDKIFIPFKRLHSYDDYQGTGIGLSICKKIVENLGGNIWVESQLGQGSTFYFTIPKAMKKEN